MTKRTRAVAIHLALIMTFCLAFAALSRDMPPNGAFGSRSGQPAKPDGGARKNAGYDYLPAGSQPDAENTPNLFVPGRFFQPGQHLFLRVTAPDKGGRNQPASVINGAFPPPVYGRMDTPLFSPAGYGIPAEIPSTPGPVEPVPIPGPAPANPGSNPGSNPDSNPGSNPAPGASPTPVPSAVWLLGAAMTALAAVRRNPGFKRRQRTFLSPRSSERQRDMPVHE